MTYAIAGQLRFGATSERSSIERFALHELLGFDDVRNHDGPWTERDNLVRAPIAKGEE